MSSFVRPAFANTFGIATPGPIPIISGGTPTTVYAINLPIIGNLSFSATDLLAKSTAAAPSVVYEELPAVVIPSFLKAGFNLDNPSKVVSFLIPSSLSTVISFTSPLSFLILVLTGTISSLKRPVSYALAAFSWEWTENLSKTSLFIPNLSQTFSEVWPMLYRQFLAT